MELTPIGVIHSNYKTKDEAPNQGRYSEEKQEIEIFPEYIDGLKGVEDVTHLIVLYWLDKSDRTKLVGKPPIHNKPTGVFTNRSPNRPNPIAFSVAKILKVDDNRIEVQGLEALNNSPLIDLKPYIPDLDIVQGAKVKWFDDKDK